MAKFAYEAKNTAGKDIRGEVEAINEAEARVKLRAQRLIPLRIVGQQTRPNMVKKTTGARVKPKDLQIFTRQLATLLNSGIPILQSLDVLARSTRTGPLTTAIKEVVSNVSKGKRFGDSLAEHPRVFDRFYVNMVRAGEESGNLDSVLSRLAVYIEKSVKLKAKIKGAMVYPAAIMVVAFLVVTALMVFVIPKFQDLFKGSGQELPWLTKMVITMSDGFVAYWYLIFMAIGGLIFGIKAYYETDAGRKSMDSILIDVPLIGELIQKGSVARFTRTLSTLLESGVSIMESLDISSKVVGNTVIENALVRAKDSISEGKSLTVPLTKEKYIPGMVTQMIGVGEQTGNLDQMLAKIADFYEDEVDVTVGALTSLLEPLMMVFLGGIIAVLVVAMYLPIFNLAGAAGV